METGKFEIDVEFTLESKGEVSTGFAFVLLKREPEFPQDFGPLLGIRDDFNGIGLFLYKSKTKHPNKWVYIRLP